MTLMDTANIPSMYEALTGIATAAARCTHLLLIAHLSPGLGTYELPGNLPSQQGCVARQCVHTHRLATCTHFLGQLNKWLPILTTVYTQVTVLNIIDQVALCLYVYNVKAQTFK